MITSSSTTSSATRFQRLACSRGTPTVVPRSLAEHNFSHEFSGVRGKRTPRIPTDATASTPKNSGHTPKTSYRYDACFTVFLLFISPFFLFLFFSFLYRTLFFGVTLLPEVLSRGYPTRKISDRTEKPPSVFTSNSAILLFVRCLHK